MKPSTYAPIAVQCRIKIRIEGAFYNLHSSDPLFKSLIEVLRYDAKIIYVSINAGNKKLTCVASLVVRNKSEKYLEQFEDWQIMYYSIESKHLLQPIMDGPMSPEKALLEMRSVMAYMRMSC